MGQISSNDQKAGIRFLGELTALLSHDIKNVLAIINENAGLLEDLVFMAAEENPVAPERVAMAAGKIRQQVRRADVMVKRLNHVGHSVDQPLSSVGLVEMVENICALAERKAAMQSVILTVLPTDDPVTVKTDLFSLQQFFWRCLDGVIRSAVASNTVEINVLASPVGADIIFNPKMDIEDIEISVAQEGTASFLKTLNAELITDRDRQLLTIRLPFDMAD